MPFLGYSTLEELAIDLDPARPVYALCVSQPADVGHTITRYRAAICVAQPVDMSIIRYCRIPLGSTDYMGGRPLLDEDEVRQRSQAQDQAWQIVKSWLIDHGFIVREACFATTKDTVLLDGRAGFLVYDRDTKSYSVRTSPASVSQ